MKDRCYFCRETECLQEHHVVPRRMDGADEEENLLTLCPTCHRKLEDTYSNRFYREISRFFGFEQKYDRWYKSKRAGPGNLELKHSKEGIQEMISDYKSCMTWEEMAEKYDTTEPTILRRLKDEGVLGDRDCSNSQSQKKHSRDQVDEMVSDYKSCMCWEEMAEKYNTSHPTIMKRLREEGVLGDRDCSNNRKFDSKQVDQIVSDYKSGLSLDELAEKHGSKEITVFKRLRERGVMAPSNPESGARSSEKSSDLQSFCS